jgi:hypothetical protein
MYIYMANTPTSITMATWLSLFVLIVPSCVAQGPLSVQFAPSSEVLSAVWSTHKFAWTILVRISNEYPADTFMPVLYFPSPGNGDLLLVQHPCAQNPGGMPPSPCCLLQFAELYTNVAFSAALRQHSDVLHAGNCRDDSLNMRGMLAAMLANSTEAGAHTFITGALRDMQTGPGAIQNPITYSHQTGSITMDIDYWLMKKMLSTTSDPSSYANSDIVQKLVTMVGVMWIEILPPTVDLPGMYPYLAQSTIELTIENSKITQAYTETAQCKMTPQGVCMNCNNSIPDSAFYIYTQQGYETGVCDFRCSSSFHYSLPNSTDPTGQCMPCQPVPSTCPVGQRQQLCSAFADTGCTPCSDPIFCPAVGHEITVCPGDPYHNNGCEACTNKPQFSRYHQACEWNCGAGYVETNRQCVFRLPDGEPLAAVFTLYVSDMVPEGQQQNPNERVFTEDVYLDSLAVVLMVQKENLFIIKTERTAASAVEIPPVQLDPVFLNRRRILQVNNNQRRLLENNNTGNYTVVENVTGDANFVSGRQFYTLVETYMWLAETSDTDPVQLLVDAVYSNRLDGELSERLNTSIIAVFEIDPYYVQRALLARLLKLQGLELQGSGANWVPDAAQVALLAQSIRPAAPDISQSGLLRAPLRQILIACIVICALALWLGPCVQIQYEQGCPTCAQCDSCILLDSTDCVCRCFTHAPARHEHTQPVAIGHRRTQPVTVASLRWSLTGTSVHWNTAIMPSTLCWDLASSKLTYYHGPNPPKPAWRTTLASARYNTRNL